MAFGDRIKRWGKKIAKKVVRWGKKAYHRVKRWSRKAAHVAKRVVHGVARVGRKIVNFAQKNRDVLTKIPYIGKAVGMGIDAADSVVSGAEYLDGKIKDGSIEKAGHSIVKSAKSGAHAVKSGDLEKGLGHFKDVSHGLEVAKTAVISNEHAQKLAGMYKSAVTKKQTRSV